jgi:hypothetical protein
LTQPPVTKTFIGSRGCDLPGQGLHRCR